MYLVFHVCPFLDNWKKMVRQIKEICLRSGGMLPQKIYKLKFSEILLFALSWRYFPSTKSILKRSIETFFNFYSIALATENIHHTLTPCSLSSYSLNCPEQKTALRFSHVPKNLRVFSLNYFNTQQRVRGKRLTMFGPNETKFIEEQGSSPWEGGRKGTKLD